MNKNNSNFKTLLKEISSYATVGRLCEVDVKKNPSDEEDTNKEPEISQDQSSQEKTPPPANISEPQPEAEKDPVVEPEKVDQKEPSVEDNSIEKSEREEAEDSIENVSFVKLNSDSGIKFLLNSIIQPAIETNTLDSIAQSFSDKLNIKTPEDLEKFKENSIQFNSVIGFNQLISSMESFVNG